jgi:hypothetical protein
MRLLEQSSVRADNDDVTGVKTFGADAQKGVTSVLPGWIAPRARARILRSPQIHLPCRPGMGGVIQGTDGHLQGMSRL